MVHNPAAVAHLMMMRHIRVIINSVTYITGDGHVQCRCRAAVGSLAQSIVGHEGQLFNPLRTLCFLSTVQLYYLSISHC